MKVSLDLSQGKEYLDALRTIRAFESSPPPTDTVAYDCAWGEYTEALEFLYPEHNEHIGEAQDMVMDR